MITKITVQMQPALTFEPGTKQVSKQLLTGNTQLMELGSRLKKIGQLLAFFEQEPTFDIKKAIAIHLGGEVSVKEYTKKKRTYSVNNLTIWEEDADKLPKICAFTKEQVDNELCKLDLEDMEEKEHVELRSVLTDYWDYIYDVLYYESGGGINHFILRLKNNAIVALHPDTTGIEYSIQPWDSIREWVEVEYDDNTLVGGFGNEPETPNYSKRHWQVINADNLRVCIKEALNSY